MSTNLLIYIEAYGETDYQEADYDDSTTEMVYQEDDGTIYEDYYPMEGLGITGKF